MLVEKNKMLFYQELKTYSEKDVKSFWSFYFDEVHPENIELNKLKENERFDPHMYTIMKSCYEKAIVNGCKGH